MFKYFIIILLFTSCTSFEEDNREELLLVYESAKDFYKNKEYNLAYKNALAYWEKVSEKQYRKETGNALNLLGAISRKQGKPPEALDFYLKALDIKESLEDSVSMSNTYNNIANIYEVSGAYEEALYYHFKTVRIAKNMENQAVMEVSYRNTGIACWKNEKYEKALHYFLQSLELSEALGNEKRAAHTLNDIGVCYDELEDYSKALSYYNKTIPIWEQYENQDKVARAYNNMAIAYYHLDSLSLATDFAFKSIAFEVPERQVYAYNTLSDIYHKQGLADKVTAYAEKSIPIAEKHDMRDQLLKAYEHASEGYYEQGDSEKSRSYLKKYKELDKIMDKQREDFYETALSHLKQFEEVEKQHAIAKAGILKLHALHHQRNYYLIAIFIGLAATIAFGVVLVKKHLHLQEMMVAFPIHIRTSLSRIGGIFFHAKDFPEDAPTRLEEVDHILYRVNDELGFYMDKVKMGLGTLERFDPSIEINEIIDGNDKNAKRKSIVFLADIAEGNYIHTSKKTYLSVFEWLLRDSLKSSPGENIIEIKLWAMPGTLWLEISDFRPRMEYYYDDMSQIKALRKLGGTVSINARARGKIEIAIAFKLA